jgi:hypothetical protein
MVRRDCLRSILKTYANDQHLALGKAFFDAHKRSAHPTGISIFCWVRRGCLRTILKTYAIDQHLTWGKAFFGAHKRSAHPT